MSADPRPRQLRFFSASGRIALWAVGRPASVRGPSARQLHARPKGWRPLKVGHIMSSLLLRQARRFIITYVEADPAFKMLGSVAADLLREARNIPLTVAPSIIAPCVTEKIRRYCDLVLGRIRTAATIPLPAAEFKVNRRRTLLGLINHEEAIRKAIRELPSLSPHERDRLIQEMEGEIRALRVLTEPADSSGITKGIECYHSVTNAFRKAWDLVETTRTSVRNGDGAKCAGGGAEKPTTKKRKRRRQAAKGPTPITSKQTEALQLVGEHKGNVTAAAKAAGISRTAMTNRYNKALAKLGKKAVKQIKTQALPTDHHGHSTIPDPNGPCPPRGRVIKKPTGRGD